MTSVEEKPRPRDLALKRLSLREQSSSDLVKHLRKKGVEEVEARSVVAELAESGWVDDRRFAAAVARSEAAKGKGPMAVLAKLRQRGVAADLKSARELFRAATPAQDEAAAAREVLARRYPGLDKGDIPTVRRATQALLRRGFSHSAVRTALSWLERDDSGLLTHQYDSDIS